MGTSLRLYTCVALVAVAPMITADGVRAQSGISSASGIVADAAATKQGKFVVVTGATVELEQNVKNSPRKFTTTTDKHGMFGFREIPYGDYVLKISAPSYRTYELKFFVDSDGFADITVLLSKRPN